jgi:hypothetical protein
VSNISLPAVPGHHKGTGTHTLHKLLARPDSLVNPGTGAAVNGALQFVTRDVHITTLLYQIDQDVIPNWFGVAVADGVTDFTQPTIYFHPNPVPAGYSEGAAHEFYYGKGNPDAPGLSAADSDKRRKWWQLFEYVDRLAAQLAGAVQFGATPDQILILPFMTGSTLNTCGILPKNWLPIVTDILGDVRQRIAGIGGPLTVTNVVVAGFSYGHSVGKAFRTLAEQEAPGVLRGLMKQVWAFDGSPTQTDLVSVPGRFKAIKYDQTGTSNTSVTDVHVALARWNQYPSPVPDEEPSLPAGTDGHHLIRDFMYLDAAMKRDIAP